MFYVWLPTNGEPACMPDRYGQNALTDKKEKAFKLPHATWYLQGLFDLLCSLTHHT